MIAAVPNLKHQAAMSVADGAGLRVSEVVALKVSNVDGQRMTLRVQRGKGRKDRYAMLCPVLLEHARLLASWVEEPGFDFAEYGTQCGRPRPLLIPPRRP